MSKGTGLGQKLYIAGNDVSGDVGSLDDVACPLGADNVTGIDKLGFERIGLSHDGELDFTGFFNPATNRLHPVASALPTVDVGEVYVAAAAIGGSAAGMVAKQIGYDGKRGNEGSLRFSVKSSANGFGLEWGVLITGNTTTDQRTDATATAPATGLDQTVVSTAFGWQAYLQVLAFAGTSVTMTLQDSADNAAFANLAGGAFTAVTAAPAWQRLAGGATDTVRRYVKVNTTGVFTNAVFVLMFARNQQAVS